MKELRPWLLYSVPLHSSALVHLKEGGSWELLVAKELMRPVVGMGENGKYFQGSHLPRVLLEASEEVTYKGVVSMRKKSFLSQDGFQWELKKHQKSWPRLVPVGARGGSSGRESTVHLDLA